MDKLSMKKNIEAIQFVVANLDSIGQRFRKSISTVFKLCNSLMSLLFKYFVIHKNKKTKI